MKAVVWNGPGDIALSDVPDPTPRDPGDAVVRLAVSAICGAEAYETFDRHEPGWTTVVVDPAA